VTREAPGVGRRDEDVGVTMCEFSFYDLRDAGARQVLALLAPEVSAPLFDALAQKCGEGHGDATPSRPTTHAFAESSR
jgi:hypothetical protein